MSINDNGLIIGAHGALFTAENLTNPITVDDGTGTCANFTLEGTPPTGWTNWGHLSIDALPTPSVEGGESTVLGTWLKDNTDQNTTPKTAKLTFTGVQIDSETLGALDAMDTARVPLSLFMLVVGAKGFRWGQWWPSSICNVVGEPTFARDGYASITFEFTRMTHSLDLAAAIAATTGAKKWREGVTFDTESFAIA
jgi:hypothetical protein